MSWARRTTKMVATLGPASSSYSMFKSMALAGVDVVRLNFSHGSHAEHKERIEMIRSVAKEIRRPIGILQDLCGPKIRTSALSAPINLQPSDRLSITSATNDVFGDKDKYSENHARIGTSFPTLHVDVKPGDTILLSDGLIHLQCIDAKPDKKEIICEVIHGGKLNSHQGINLPNVKLSTECVTPKDVEDLRFGLQNGVDFVAASFVRSADDISHVKQAIKGFTSLKVPVIAKIEKPEAIANIEAIIEAADGIMVARGDLGVELPLQQVPVAQKKVIALANDAGIPVIVATQMLESMIHNPRPTRAEVSDVCNAIYDGADATMLSAETASGAFPLEALKMMIEIAEITSNHIFLDSSIISQNDKVHVSNRPLAHSPPLYQAIGLAAHAITNAMPIRAIVTFTNSGDTARMIARGNPKAPVIALTPHERTTRQLSLVKNVFPFLVKECHTLTELTEISEKVLLNERIASVGDNVIITSSHPIPRDVSVFHLSTNFLKMIKVGLGVR